ncbi:pantoate--beta-alanine ligase [Deinococcus psychrotolerans]|uniref:Pantothenate synthetase n=1 Tax=Deinococcus psychrotolerans TaxID=2489213 RepID=A0A3G8YJ69_9DEIO|nr:pantoate--beta-alanine ligase [Deinococcus psychrotolerans]AZI41481.1 pantoate--beta-alanine ligase [Deinococcus psychrotolerans]
MQLVHSPAELLSVLRKDQTGTPESLGLVPTMGALHAGHTELIRRARAENTRVVLSLFVNPLQFGPHEDFAAYPRDLAGDARIAEDAGVDILFAPPVSQMYSSGFASRVSVEGVSEGFDGASRPGHFTGVATVVLKLLNLVQPTRAYFGEKDWQQLAVVRRMVRDLNVPVEIVGVPTVRSALPHETGLALSSRNTYLSAEQRSRAAVLSRALRAAQALYAAGERRSKALLAAASAELASESGLTLDYLALVDGDMNEREWVDNEGVSAESLAEYRLLVAARLFGVRLIDNMPLISADALTAAL